MGVSHAISSRAAMRVGDPCGAPSLILFDPHPMGVTHTHTASGCLTAFASIFCCLKVFFWIGAIWGIILVWRDCNCCTNVEEYINYALFSFSLRFKWCVSLIGCFSSQMVHMVFGKVPIKVLVKFIFQYIKPLPPPFIIKCQNNIKHA